MPCPRSPASSFRYHGSPVVAAPPDLHHFIGILRGWQRSWNGQDGASKRNTFICVAALPPQSAYQARRCVSLCCFFHRFGLQEKGRTGESCNKRRRLSQRVGNLIWPELVASRRGGVLSGKVRWTDCRTTYDVGLEA